MRRPPAVPLYYRFLELRDGDRLRLAYGPDRPGPAVIILHGLGGCARSPYVLGLASRLARQNMQAVMMEFRGAGGVPNRLQRFFHAGEWQDLEETVRHVRATLGSRPLALVGFSMGGVVALNWLANRGSEADARAVVTVSAPLDLTACSRHLDRGFARLYQWHLVRNLKRLIRIKHGEAPMPAVVRELKGIRTLWDFDDRVTAPMHGFRDAGTYYRLCSPTRHLTAIRRPTLMIHAADDPFIPRGALPHRLPPPVRMRLSEQGGHVGFVHGSAARTAYWLDEEIPGWLQEVL